MNRSQAVARVLNLLAGVAAEIAADPLAALTTCGLAVRAVPGLQHRRGSGGACDGVSFREHGVVLYASSPHSRRENFTLVHELVHHITDTDDELLDWLADLPDASLETEALCDAAAQRLLLPDSIIDTVVGGDPSSAAHLRQLYDSSAASEPVCAIALSARLPCQGAVLISDLGGGTVSYSSVHAPDNEGWPRVFPWPGRELPTGHPLRSMAAGQTRRLRSFWQAPWGDRQDFYLDAVAGTRRVHTVLAVYDLWQVSSFHVGDRPESADRPQRELTCPCGYVGTVTGFPCPDCHQPFCPRCRECRHQRQERELVQCQECFSAVKPSQLRDDGARCLYCE